jgi:TonB family protein
MTAIVQALSAALLDFVWQGLLAAFLLWAALLVLRNRSARARYLASCAALAAMAALPIITACLLYKATTVPHASLSAAGAAASTMRVAISSHAGSPFDWTGLLSRWALPVWSLGVLLFSLRLVWASRQISVLRRLAKPAEEPLLAVVGGLRRRMQLTRPVRVLISTVADCPSVIGWFRPVVLLPTATVLGLTPQQLEAVLAHELAHILRYDYLVNMLQTVAETLLFYHPAVWWASARIRQERELCCDDLAVASCGDALCYARALTKLERLRATAPALALGSTGGSLLQRIQRLTGDAGWQRGPSKLPGILALSLGLICLALNMQWARGQQPEAASPVAAAEENDGPDDAGVRVDLRGSSVVHRDGVDYPGPAIEKGVKGTVVVEATLDADGAVSDARVVSGPPELRKAALESVLQWHFTHDAAGSTRQVGITFEPPAASGAVRRKKVKDTEAAAVQQKMAHELAQRMAEQAQALEDAQKLAGAEDQEAQARRLTEMLAKLQAERSHASEDIAKLLAEQRKQASREQSAVKAEIEARVVQDDLEALQSPAAVLALHGEDLEKAMAEFKAGQDDFDRGAMFIGRRLKTIEVQGLSSPSRDELLARLPLHVGDTLSNESMEKVTAAVKQFDEHLGVSMFTTRDGEVEIRISAPQSH